MSGFDLASLLPTYLDEVDEQIAALNETLLRLEQAPDDEKAIRDAFRLVHTVKGSSTMMGFAGVKELTHHLETFFDQLRSRKRALDRAFLDHGAVVVEVHVGHVAVAMARHHIA